ncbi:family 10 glycosylhydrolase [candidate division KSB1 bacterium]|nr:family 10 glycosylhydrolase [candidate division KSB1 bacterium]
MKKTTLFLLLFYIALYASINEEFRATWVVTWEHSLNGAPIEQQKAHIDKILDNHVDANMNAVLWQARRGGEVYYPSDFEPWGRDLGYTSPGFDPLAYVIEQAHARGLELHVWFNVFANASTQPGTPAAEHPDWICRDRSGHPMTSHRALSPGLAEVRQYLNAVAMEIVRHYDLDGLHLDYVRWNEHYSSNALLKTSHLLPEEQSLDGLVSPQHIQDLVTNQSSRYLYDTEHPYDDGTPAGFDSWEEWWRWSVTEFVRTLHDSIQQAKPWVRLSAAVLGKYNWSSWQAYGTVYQDAALWFNQGFVDQLMPMHYHWYDGDGFYSVLTGGCPACWQQYIQPGIDLGRLYSVGPPSYVLSEKKIWNNHTGIVERCRTVPWVDGFQFFRYGFWQDWRYFSVAASTVFPQKSKIRASGLINSDTPVAPTVHLSMQDSLNWILQVQPGMLPDYDQWFAVYRSYDSDIDVDRDEIIYLQFGSADFLVAETFDGSQDYNGKYYYAATMLDRYWNESVISNAVSSDSLISFPPRIVVTNPAPGDTISVHSSLTLDFSKTMNPESLQVTFAPGKTIDRYEWDSEYKRVRIFLQKAFDFDTEYQVTVHASITDINGKALDANGDAVGGDDFVFSFYTYSADIFPPRLLSAYPKQELPPIDAVFSFVFDEPLNEKSLNDSTILFMQNDQPVESNFAVTVVDDIAVLSIQPVDALENNAACEIELLPGLGDTLGNTTSEKIVNAFVTREEYYSQTDYLDRFWGTGNWERPSYSGSTTGILEPNSGISISQDAYRPALPVPQRKSLRLDYAWDETADNHLIRLYMSGTQPRAVYFDTTWVVQCWLFGDGSNNQFRFCVDDSTKDKGAFHEVSKWITIDWYGWRLIEWRLNDRNSVGSWLGDGVLHGPSMRFDSFQFTHSEGAASTGSVYFDDLRLVKKAALSDVESRPLAAGTPEEWMLYQNYPNPFNPVTQIPFTVAEPGHVELIIYDIRGRQVNVLLSGVVAPGRHTVVFDGSDLASGIYYYRFKAGNQVFTRRMALIK